MNKEEPKQEDKLCHYSGLSSPLVYAEEYKQEYEYAGECNGNNGNGCFMDSPGHDCGCFTKAPKEEPKDNNFYEKLKQYFETTPREKVLEDWAKSAEYDKVGPTVDDFLNNSNKQRANLQSLESELDEVLSKETEESLTTRLNEKRSKQETLEEAGVVYAKTVNENHTSHMLGFHNGAKWQQERMYSEEDMINFAFDTYHYISELMKVPFNQISENKLHAMYNFEQFKNR